jgi:hypothetical protein
MRLVTAQTDFKDMPSHLIVALPAGTCHPEQPRWLRFAEEKVAKSGAEDANDAAEVTLQSPAMRQMRATRATSALLPLVFFFWQ